MGLGGVTHEEVVGVWVRAADSEEFHQVVELSVYVPTHGDGTFLWWYGQARLYSLVSRHDSDLRPAAHSTPLVILPGPTQ